MLDYKIMHGSVLDGSGDAAFAADIGIQDGRIAAVGALGGVPAASTLDARGMTVTPGFLDIHRHADLAAFRPGFGELELRQGLTTIVNGNCGLSAAPFGAEHRDEILTYLAPILGRAQAGLPTARMADYLRALERERLPVNVGMLVGGGVVRADVSGYRADPLDGARLRRIHQGLEQALADGAFGVSLGLGYAPECFYSTDGLIAALAPLAHTDIPVTVHMREEGSDVDKAVEEMLTVARALRCPLHISHLKAMGKRNWGRKIPAILNTLHRACEDGMDVRWDVYPYTAGSTQLLHIMPPSLLRGGTNEICRRLRDPAERRALREHLRTGTDFDNISLLVGWENIVMSSLRLPENRQYIGKTVAEVAALRGQEPEDCVFDLLADERCTITMIDFIASEEDIGAILRSDRVNIISDSTYPTEGVPHPRLYGTFARILEKYVRQDGVLTLPEAVHRMTDAPAQSLRIAGKGRIAVGYDADLLVFDPAAVHEAGTYADPARFAQGMRDVFVGGRPAILGGTRTDAASGVVLRR